jgi:hypothetical protein
MVEEKTKRKEYVVKVGEKLYIALQKQKQKIREVTMDCVKASDYEAGEIIAKKLAENNLI